MFAIQSAAKLIKIADNGIPKTTKKNKQKQQNIIGILKNVTKYIFNEAKLLSKFIRKL